MQGSTCDEAIQLSLSQRRSWIASRSLSSGAHSRDPLARNDGVSTGVKFQTARGRASALSRREAPELCVTCRPQREQEGAGKAGCALHPRSRVQTAHRKRTRAYRFSGNTPAFPAQWFYGLFRALPGERAFLPPSSPGSFASRKLDASVAASGPHDFAVRAACVRLSQAPRPPHPTARFVTIASRPSHRVRQAKLNTDLAFREKRNIFYFGA